MKLSVRSSLRLLATCQGLIPQLSGSRHPNKMRTREEATLPHLLCNLASHHKELRISLRTFLPLCWGLAVHTARETAIASHRQINKTNLLETRSVPDHQLNWVALWEEEGSLLTSMVVKHSLRISLAMVFSSKDRLPSWSPHKFQSQMLRLQENNLSLKGLNPRLKTLWSWAPLTCSSWWIRLAHFSTMLIWTSDPSQTMRQSSSTSSAFQSNKEAVKALLQQAKMPSRNFSKLIFATSIVKSLRTIKNTPAAQFAARTSLRRPPAYLVDTCSTKSASENGSISTTSAQCADLSCPLMMLSMREPRRAGWDTRLPLHQGNKTNNEHKTL